MFIVVLKKVCLKQLSKKKPNNVARSKGNKDGSLVPSLQFQCKKNMIKFLPYLARKKNVKETSKKKVFKKKNFKAVRCIPFLADLYRGIENRLNLF